MVGAANINPSAAQIVRAELFPVSIRYLQPVTWTIGGQENAADYLVLKLTAADGAAGAAEIICKPAWNGVTQGVLVKAFQEMAWPAIVAEGLPDVRSGARLGARFRGATALQSLLDNACRDLHAARDQSGETSADKWINAAFLLTRANPDVMARSAAHAVQELGYRAVKIKAGQGLDTDREVLHKIRDATGAETRLSIDANSAYSQADALLLGKMAADIGAIFLEDPCPLVPTNAFRSLLADCPIAVLVDKSCASIDMANSFADLGAKLFSAKPNRLGFTEAAKIAERAADSGGRICVGMFGESAAGAVVQLQFASAYCTGPYAFETEAGFHLDLSDNYLAVDLTFSQGAFCLPADPRLARLIDWPKLTALSDGVICLDRQSE